MFNKKAKKEQDVDSIDINTENSKVNKAEYKITLFEKLSGTVRIIKSFDAVRWRDEEDHVVYLKNDKLKFLEIFPDKIDDMKNYTEEEVDRLIKRNEEILRKEREKDTNLNEKGIEFEILKLKAKKRSFNFDENSSYLSFGEGGKPTFYFLRQGSNFFPFKWDTETKTIFIPSDNRKKSASIALRNKENKYSKHKKLLTGGVMLMFIIGIVMLSVGAYTWYKSNEAYKEFIQAYDDTELAKYKRMAIDGAIECSELTLNMTRNTQEILENIKDDLNKPQTVITGIVPK